MFTTQQKTLVEKVCGSLNIPFEIREGEAFDPNITFDDVFDISLCDRVFIVSRITVIPGVRYTANGDGWPDESDLVEIAQHLMFEEALKEALRCVADERVNNMVDTLVQEAELATMRADL